VQLEPNPTSATPLHDGSLPQVQTAIEPSPNLGAAKKPRVWSVFLAGILLTVAGLVATTIYLGIAAALVIGSEAARDPKPSIERMLENPNIVIPSFAIMGLFALLVTMVCTILSPERALDRLSLRSSHFGIKGFIAAVAASLGISIAAGQVIQVLGGDDGTALKTIDRVLRSANVVMFVIGAVIIAGLAPVAEEVFFRGYMQTRLRDRWGAKWAIAITAIAFGLFHADRIQTPAAIVMGLALGYIAESSGSIRPAVVCHVINNLVAVIGARFIEDDEQASGNWLAAIAGIVISMFGILWLRKHMQMRRARG
jgi:membrane protease YdiL (CAAX protease family)